MRLKKYQAAISVTVLVITGAVFVYYLHTHPEVIDQLSHLGLGYIIILLLLYLGLVMSLTVVNTISVWICGKQIGKKESFALTSTSSIANFFGPLQSGVGIRAAYFKTKLSIPIKKYGLISLYYYGFYAAISGMFLIFGSQQFRIPLLVLGLTGGAATFFYIKKKTAKTEVIGKNAGIHLAQLALAVSLQMLLTVAIYFTQLRAVGSTASISQIISYTGAANFSLFVAITPGAIGIREAFLVFSQGLHQIDQATIIAANVVDRGVYVLFLGLLFFGLAITHTTVTIKAKRKQKQSE